MSGTVLWLLAAVFMAGLFCFGLHLARKHKQN